MQEAWQPLAGVKVVDFSMFVPGPFCTAMLADLGAEVIKVESLAGDPSRGYIPVQFRTENRNKRSIALNLKNPLAREVVDRLARHADIVIEGFRHCGACPFSADHRGPAGHVLICRFKQVHASPTLPRQGAVLLQMRCRVFICAYTR